MSVHNNKHYATTPKVTAAQREKVIADYKATEAVKTTVAMPTPKTKRLTQAEKAAIVWQEQRKAKAHAFGSKIAGNATACGNATAKVGSLLWKGAFGLVHGAVRVVENAPKVVVATTVTAGRIIADEYKKA
jgi:hypothetical protein